VLEVKVGCTADYDGLKPFDGEQFAGCGAGDRDAKVIGNLLRLLFVPLLNGNQCGIWMP
jgi:hypothetical protein